MRNLSTHFFTIVLCLFSLQSLAQRNDIEELIRNQRDKKALTLIKDSIGLGTMTSVDAFHLMHLAMEYEQPLSFLALLQHPELDPRAVIVEGTSTIRIFDLFAMTIMERHVTALFNPESGDVPLDFDLVMSAFNNVILLHNVLENDNFAFLINQGLGDFNFVFRALSSVNEHYSLDLLCLSLTILSRARLLAFHNFSELEELYFKIFKSCSQAIKKRQEELAQTARELQLIHNQTQANDAHSDEGEWISADVVMASFSTLS